MKNLPHGTKPEELRNIFGKFGDIEKVLLPPSGITAIIQFVHPSEARSAFRSLAFSKVGLHFIQFSVHFYQHFIFIPFLFPRLNFTFCHCFVLLHFVHFYFYLILLNCFIASLYCSLLLLLFHFVLFLSPFCPILALFLFHG